MCSLTSDCTAGLVCRFGTCTTACVEDRDCAVGATCGHDVASGASACVEPVTELCVYSSDCPPPLVCGEAQRCRLECRADRDCPLNRYCDATLSLCELREPLDGG